MLPQQSLIRAVSTQRTKAARKAAVESKRSDRLKDKEVQDVMCRTNELSSKHELLGKRI